MAGDLEDFLKRAAERRAAKQQQGGGGGRPKPQPNTPTTPGRPAPSRPAPSRSTPEYTESRRERQPRPAFEEAIPVAELVEPVNPLAEQQKRTAEAVRKAKEVKERVAQQQRDIHEPKAADRGSITIAGGSPAEQLLDLLQRPGGVQQAFLLQEIMQRPDDRW